MSKKTIVKLIFLLFVLIFNVLVIRNGRFGNVKGENITLGITASSDKDSDYQVYYADTKENLTEERSAVSHVNAGETQNIEFAVPSDSKVVRLDFGSGDSSIAVTEMYFGVGGYKDNIPMSELEGMIRKDSSDINIESGGETLKISVKGADPYAFIDFDVNRIERDYRAETKTRDLIISIILCIIMDMIAVYAVIHFAALLDVPTEIFRHRKIALTLAKNDFKTKYAGSYLGIVWAFIQPIVTILVYWFVFQVGFRSGNMKGHPFVLYLVSGLVPWFFFSDGLNGGTASLTEYSYLVKKVVFNIDILPFIKVVAALFVHTFFIVFAIGLECLLGYYPSLYLLQLLYYIFCSFVFTLGITYLTSAVVVFFRDLTQFINIFVLQVGMWLTPIMWDENILPAWLKVVFRLNPMFYVVDGFRDSMIYHRWVWDGKALWTVYFWVITFLAFGFGTRVFRRLKVHFADVL